MGGTAPPYYAPFLSAAAAATIELSIMQPLDVVKTRMHLQGAGVRTGDNFQGTIGAIRGIHSAEGLAGLWRGFAPGLCVVIPRRGFKFLFYDAFVSLLWRGEKGKAPFLPSMIAGGMAGASEACIITPLECIKIAMQSEKASGASASTGMLAFASAMVRSGGVSCLYAGLTATMAKHTAHSCFYFASFHQGKQLLNSGDGQPSRIQRVAIDLSAGFIAGCAAATANNPFDVAKTRLQVGAASGVSKHAVAQEFAAASSSRPRSTAGMMMDLIRADGPQALYKGYVAKVARLGPGSAIIFAVYEQLMGMFSSATP